MTNSELIGLILIMVFYVIVGIIIARNVYVAIDREPKCALKYEKIMSEEALHYIRWHAFGLSWVCGMLWIFYGIFSIWAEIGTVIYNELIIDEDEESRIAAWLF